MTTCDAKSLLFPAITDDPTYAVVLDCSFPALHGGLHRCEQDGEVPPLGKGVTTKLVIMWGSTLLAQQAVWTAPA